MKLIIEGPDAYRRVTICEGANEVTVYVGTDGVTVTEDGKRLEPEDSE